MILGDDEFIFYAIDRNIFFNSCECQVLFFRHIEKLNPELLDRSDGQIFDMMQWKCLFFAGHHCYRWPLDQATVGFNGS